MTPICNDFNEYTKVTSYRKQMQAFTNKVNNFQNISDTDNIEMIADSHNHNHNTINFKKADGF